MSRILREFKKEPLTILCSPTHESYQTNLSKLPYNFILWDHYGAKPWHRHFRPIPQNHIYLKNLTSNIKFDCVLSQNKANQFQIMDNIAKEHNVPHVVLTHTTPGINAPKEYLKNQFDMQGNVNVFITEYSANEWGFVNGYEVVNHMVDTERFKSSNKSKRSYSIISVVNDLKDRNRECGYDLWEAITERLDRKLVGTCGYGIGKPADGPEDLINQLNDHIIFLNTSLISPLPMSLLEAMSCGLVVVSAATCQIPNVIKHQYNGFLYNPDRPQDARKIIDQLLEIPVETLKQIGQNARDTILKEFSETNFVNKWKSIFENVCT